MSKSEYSIIDVVRDIFAGTLELADDDTIRTRNATCESCEVRNHALNTCTACGCFLPAKVRLKESTCPMELW